MRKYVVLVILLALFAFNTSCEPELDRDTKVLCGKIRHAFLYTGDYQLLWRFGDVIKQAKKNSEGRRIVNTLANLGSEIKSANRTAYSVRRLESQILAQCGFDDLVGEDRMG